MQWKRELLFGYRLLEIADVHSILRREACEAHRQIGAEGVAERGSPARPADFEIEVGGPRTVFFLTSS